MKEKNKTKTSMKENASTNLRKDGFFKRFFSFDLMFLGNFRLLFDRCLVDFSKQFRLPVFAAVPAGKAAGNAECFGFLFFVLHLLFLLLIQFPSNLECIQLAIFQFLHVW
jgi:hypothetical protein